MVDNKRLGLYAKEFLKAHQDYKDYWNYEDGVVLEGARFLYEATGEEEYRAFVLNYLDRRVEEDGTIPTFPEQFALDSFKSGTLLFFGWDQTKKEKYRKAMDFLIGKMKDYPRTKCGSFWHKDIYENQIWLDGLYMMMPFYMEYDTRFGGKEHYADILNQFQNVKKYLYCEEKGLYFHGYDEAKIQPWANPETGCSSNFWSRAEGWWLMSMVDTLSRCDMQIYEIYRGIADLLPVSVDGLLPYRAEKDGLIYQVIDRPDVPGNYTETSGSVMAACTLMKASLMRVLDPDRYLKTGREMFESIIENKLLKGEDGRDHLYDICCVAGLGPGEKRNGSVEYYLSEPKKVDEAKGVGAFLMAYAMYLQTEELMRQYS